jgi:hypothetical protein
MYRKLIWGNDFPISFRWSKGEETSVQQKTEDQTGNSADSLVAPKWWHVQPTVQSSLKSIFFQQIELPVGQLDGSILCLSHCDKCVCSAVRFLLVNSSAYNYHA